MRQPPRLTLTVTADERPGLLAALALAVDETPGLTRIGDPYRHTDEHTDPELMVTRVTVEIVDAALIPPCPAEHRWPSLACQVMDAVLAHHPLELSEIAGTDWTEPEHVCLGADRCEECMAADPTPPEIEISYLIDDQPAPADLLREAIAATSGIELVGDIDEARWPAVGVDNQQVNVTAHVLVVGAVPVDKTWHPLDRGITSDVLEAVAAHLPATYGASAGQIVG